MSDKREATESLRLTRKAKSSLAVAVFGLAVVLVVFAQTRKTGFPDTIWMRWAGQTLIIDDPEAVFEEPGGAEVEGFGVFIVGRSVYLQPETNWRDRVFAWIGLHDAEPDGAMYEVSSMRDPQGWVRLDRSE